MPDDYDSVALGSGVELVRPRQHDRPAIGARFIEAGLARTPPAWFPPSSHVPRWLGWLTWRRMTLTLLRGAVIGLYDELADLRRRPDLGVSHVDKDSACR